VPAPKKKISSKKTRKGHGFATMTVHAGQVPDPTTGAVMQPIYQVSTYRQPGLDSDWPYDYARTINPTRRALERNLAALEGGADARCFASGMSAVSAILHLFKAGDHVIVSENVYGGTYRLFEGLLRQFGLDFSWVDTSDLAVVEGAIQKNTKMIFVETPTNPTLTLTDLAKVSRIAKKHRLILTVDNTFMSPALQNPIALGADIVMHSTTKYINGHSDSVGGCVVTTRKKHVERIAWIQNTVGAILSPMDSFMVLRGIKTLALRMERHDRSARKIAAWLEAHPKVSRVIYPGLKSHPQHALAKKQMRGFGGMISFDMGSLARAKRLLARVRLCAMAESLGGVESLISHPASMTHGAVPREERDRIGVTDGLVRISVGIEDPEDLIADLDRALR
jgi:cystathionine beta-lyase/cystathionine gamma-synthase